MSVGTSGFPWVIHNDDALTTLAAMPAGSFDGMLCDPPYGLRFMGKAWDYDVPSVATWREALRVLKPGAFALVACGTRTQHRMVVNLEDAGFEIRDVVAWLYGQGFPKSHDVSKAIDRTDATYEREHRARTFQAWLREHLTPRQVNEATGTDMGHHLTTHPTQPFVATPAMLDRLRPLLPPVPEHIEQIVAERAVESANMKAREVVGTAVMVDTSKVRAGFVGPTYSGDAAGATREVPLTRAFTSDAARWQGYGTALKPALELWTLVRKPLDGTVAANALKHGVGGLNIDGCRVATDDPPQPFGTPTKSVGGLMNKTGDLREKPYEAHTAGRWPANVIHDGSDEVLAGFPDTASGQVKPGTMRSPTSRHSVAYADMAGGCELTGFGDFGSAARFFYVAKADTTERDAGLPDRNPHPTVKPIALTTYLARLILPPERTDGTPRRILVPFAGVGSEMIGARLAGWDHATGIEREPEYAAIAQARLAHHTAGRLW